jgi:hypothetical protein
MTRTKKTTNKSLQVNAAKRPRTADKTENAASNNIYNALSDESEDDDTTMIERNPAMTKVAAAKPPPINFLGKSLDQVKAILTRLQIEKYEMKLTTEGIRLFLMTTETYKKVREELKVTGVQYFTHQLREDQMSKFVLHGLPELDTDEIASEIKTSGSVPQAIKKMHIKKARYTGHSVYLVLFKKSDHVLLTNLNEQCRVLSNVRVTWEHFKNKATGPTQCRNCQRFGHGSANCNAKPRCVRCALEHKSNDCPLLKNEMGENVRTRVDEAQLRCAQCGQNHTATFKNCEKRAQFMTNRRPPNRLRVPKPATSMRFAPAPELNDFNFPTLTPVPSQRPSQPIAFVQSTPSQSLPLPQQQQSEELFSADELLSIFCEMTDQIAKATSKTQQIQILMKIALKHCPTYHV